jgi:glutaconate CoA-transferase subunit B
MSTCTLGEMMIYRIARTIEDGALAFHGFGSPLVQLALHVAKRTHAPRLVLIAGATYGVNPDPPFLTATTNDWTLDRGASSSLGIGELFDLAASGRLDRMFLSGLQIDRFGNCNVTGLGKSLAGLKLPGGGGGCNLSCDARRLTLWTAAHRCPPNKQGVRKFRLVDRCDFVTSLGYRASDGTPRQELGHIGLGPDWLVTDLGVFDFDDSGQLRLHALYPDTTVQDVLDNTGFAPAIDDAVKVAEAPTQEIVDLIRRLDPMKIHEREPRPEDRSRRFELRAA